MKNVLMLLALSLFSFSAFSQNLPIPSFWKIKKIGVSMGIDQDMIKGLDYHYMLQSTHSTNLDRFANLDINDEDFYSGVCENPQVRLMATLEVPGMKNTELNVGIQGIFNRYDGVYYYNNDFDDQANNDDYEYLSITSMTSELGLEGSMTKRLSLWNWNFYLGAGTNLGYSFDGHMNVSGYRNVAEVEKNLNRSMTDIALGRTLGEQDVDERFYEDLDVKNTFHQRVFAQVGIGWIIFRRLEVGVDYRRGIGYKAMYDAPTKLTNLHSISAGVKWILR